MVFTEREATVTVVLADGTRLKCRDLMAPILWTARCDTLIDRVLTLESTNDVRSLGPLLQSRT